MPGMMEWAAIIVMIAIAVILGKGHLRRADCLWSS